MQSKLNAVCLAVETLQRAYLFSKSFAVTECGSDLHGCDFSDEGQHRLYSELGNRHDECFTASFHLLL